MLADKYQLTREELGQYALRSHQLAAAATRAGAFDQEVVPLAVEGGRHTEDQ